MNPKIYIIGGGAAGIFGAINTKIHFPMAEIVVLEKSSKLLSKVKVSGGGRCNVTHACFENSQLVKFYPRGNKSLRKPFNQFSTQETVDWFEKRGVKLKTEEDGRIFPTSNNSQTIIDCLLQECEKLGISINKSVGVESISVVNERFQIHVKGGQFFKADRILIATGGQSKAQAYDWLSQLNHHIKDPVPSLFTFNVPDSDFKDLAGISVPHAQVKILGSKLNDCGPLLITHWGFSGPAVLKLSAWGARELHLRDYNFSIHINWLGEVSEEGLKDQLLQFKKEHPKKVISSNPLFDLPRRLWARLVDTALISNEKRWVDISKKQFNKLIEGLIRSEFKVKGKTTFKEEFVTCGGISLKDINLQTMESKKQPGIFFAGEVLDVDGVTGGFNFQHAWTSAFIASKNILAPD
ncbi:NAD(P)/FAD-dependent oxidoreductase [Xanthovirga aplysinae]|uniref:NAD(P)/FAD-dependent oxidoreductase n=1 Tax=Xanthovirga aplysinae TaxID=2529853 RepID=UPI0012BBB699|nr:NAD(P)/FAD-dependent oxidoreductase [Xanthovirga aplysinae]MTI31941.1 NAD(P)/FAD-dependent oxidoreductase [Xanthovirga aplysinae]